MNAYKLDLADKKVSYRYFVGSNKIVYLKAEMATYLELGRRLHAVYGCSVICVLGFGSIETDKRIIADFIQRHNLANVELFYFSHARGCFDGLELASDGVPFKKMVFVNMPRTDVFEASVGRLKVIPDTGVVAIFAEKERSFECVLLLKNKGLPNVEILMSRDVYHSCKIVIDAFKELE